jgi:hypothetical protein
MSDAQFAALMACISAQTVSVVAMLAIVFNRIVRLKGPMGEVEIDEAKEKPMTPRKISVKKAGSELPRNRRGKQTAGSRRPQAARSRGYPLGD